MPSTTPRSTLEMLEGRQNTGRRHAAAAVFIAAALSLFTAAVGLFGEYVLVPPEGDRGSAWLFGGFAALFGAAALLALVYKRRIDSGVVVDMHLTQLGRADDRSSTWDRTVMTSFAGLHRSFSVQPVPWNGTGDAVARADVTGQLGDLVSGLDRVLEAHHADLVRITPEGPIPAIIGMGALTFLPSDFRLFEVPDNATPGRGGFSREQRERFLEFDAEAYRRIVSRHDPDVQAEEQAQLRVTVDGKDVPRWRETFRPDPSVRRVRLSLGAVKKGGIECWMPFAEVPLWGESGPFIQAGALLDGTGPDTQVGSTPTGAPVRRFASVQISQLTSTGRASATSRREQATGDALVADPETVAIFFADVLAWTLARYPNAQIHLTARVPRVIAFMLGAALAHTPHWPARKPLTRGPASSLRHAPSGAPPPQSTSAPTRFFPADMAARLRLWGTYDAPTTPHDGRPGLALFDVFPETVGLTPLGAHTTHSQPAGRVSGRLSRAAQRLRHRIRTRPRSAP